MRLERKLLEDQPNVVGVFLQDVVETADGRRAERSLEIGKLNERDPGVGGALYRRAGDGDDDRFVEYRGRLAHLFLEVIPHLLDSFALAEFARRDRGQAPAARAIRIFYAALGDFQSAAADARFGAQQCQQIAFLRNGETTLVEARQIRNGAPCGGIARSLREQRSQCQQEQPGSA